MRGRYRQRGLLRISLFPQNKRKILISDSTNKIAYLVFSEPDTFLWCFWHGGYNGLKFNEHSLSTTPATPAFWKTLNRLLWFACVQRHNEFVKYKQGAISSGLIHSFTDTCIHSACIRHTIIQEGDYRSETGNHRPLSLTCVVCGVLKSMVRGVIVEHLEINELIKISQNGFMKGRSCLTNLLHGFFEEVYDELDRPGLSWFYEGIR